MLQKVPPDSQKACLPFPMLVVPPSPAWGPSPVLACLSFLPLLQVLPQEPPRQEKIVQARSHHVLIGDSIARKEVWGHVSSLQPTLETSAGLQRYCCVSSGWPASFEVLSISLCRVIRAIDVIASLPALTLRRRNMLRPSLFSLSLRTSWEIVFGS
jgi:hypothetical protein